MIRPSSKVLASGTLIVAAGMLFGSWAPFELRAASFDEVLRAYLDAGRAGPASGSDAVANTALSVPFAFVFCGFLFSFGGAIGWRIAATLLVMLGTAFLSLLCEVPQGWVVHRVPSAHDTLAQLVGGVVGCGLWWLLGGVCMPAIEQLAVAPKAILRIQAGLTLAAVVALFWSILPGQVLLSPNEFAQKWATGRIELIPFSRPISSLSDAVFKWGWTTCLGIPLGLCAAVFVRPKKLSVAGQLLLIFALGVLPELIQLVVKTRFALATDVLFSMLGVAIGYVVASQALLRYSAAADRQGLATELPPGLADPFLWCGLAVVVWFIVCLIAWYPFDFVTEPRLLKERLVEVRSNPVADHRGSNLRLMFATLRAAMLAGVAGVCCGVSAALVKSALRRRLVLLGFLLAVVAMAVGVELGQLLERSHSGGGTGVLARTMGGWVGMAAGWALARSRPREQ